MKVLASGETPDDAKRASLLQNPEDSPSDCLANCGRVAGSDDEISTVARECKGGTDVQAAQSRQEEDEKPEDVGALVAIPGVLLLFFLSGIIAMLQYFPVTMIVLLIVTALRNGSLDPDLWSPAKEGSTLLIVYLVFCVFSFVGTLSSTTKD